MIGTTFKLGFDGTSVGQGLGNMSRMLGSFGKQIGVGMAQRVGHGVTDLMGRILMAVPDMMKETADWAGNLNDMSNQTGVGISKLVQLEEALRLSGASAKDTSRMISILADNLHGAATEGGPAMDALHKLGFFATEFKDIGIDEAFEKIMRKVATLPQGFKGLETTMADLFGARMGYKLIRFAKDFDGSMAQAANNVKNLGNAMETEAVKIDDFADAMGRWENFKKSASSILISEWIRASDGFGPNQFYDMFDPEKLRQPIREMIAFIKSEMGEFMADPSGYFGEIFKNMGRSIGEGIKESIMPNIPSLPKWLGGSASTGGSASSDLSALIQKSNTLLADIRKEVGVAKFA